MPRLLQFTRKVDIESTGDNTFILDFSSQSDRRRILTEGPWSFFRDLIVIKEPEGLDEPRSMSFEEISIWVQCHNVAIAFLTKDILERIGSKIGKVEEIDEGDSGSYLGRFVRIRIRLNISQPLKRFVRVGVDERGDEVIIILTYERVPDFCYKCGVLGHSHRECGMVSIESSKLDYGPWLRAQKLGNSGKGKQSSPKKKYPSQLSSNDTRTNEEGPMEALELIKIFFWKTIQKLI